jgi:hypothetical protein
MTLADQDVPVLAWNEPDGLVARGTVVVLPGRGELPTVYEPFGRRLAGELVSITADRHDVLNDKTHRTAAAVVVLFLERIRQDSDPSPIAVPEQLGP